MLPDKKHPPLQQTHPKQNNNQQLYNLASAGFSFNTVDLVIYANKFNEIKSLINAQETQSAKVQNYQLKMSQIMCKHIDIYMKKLGLSIHQVELSSVWGIKYKLPNPQRQNLFVCMLIGGKQLKNLFKQMSRLKRRFKKIFFLSVFCDKQLLKQAREYSMMCDFISCLETENLHDSLAVYLGSKENKDYLIDKLKNKGLSEQVLRKIESNSQLVNYPIDIHTLYQQCLKQQKEEECPQIEQVIAFPQKHQNLCGFHALHNIKELNNEGFLSQNRFLQNYQTFSTIVQNQLNPVSLLKIDIFSPLQRQDLKTIIEHKLLENKNICTMFLSENYILNPPEQLQILQQKIQDVKNGKSNELFIVMGVFCHYFVLRLYDHHKIMFIDSMNPSLSMILSGLILKKNPNRQEVRRVSDMKTAITSIKDIFLHSQTIQAILCRLRIEQIIGSYEKLSDLPSKQKWLQEEFPVPVIKNDLISELQNFTGHSLGVQYQERIRKWVDDEFVKKNIIFEEEGRQFLKKIGL